MTPAAKTVHTHVLCSDEVVRRFYPDAAPYHDSHKKPGHVEYGSIQVRGVAIARGEKTPLFRTTDPSLPKCGGFHLLPNCAARHHCAKTSRCVGGCRR